MNQGMEYMHMNGGGNMGAMAATNHTNGNSMPLPTHTGHGSAHGINQFL